MGAETSMVPQQIHSKNRTTVTDKGDVESELQGFQVVPILAQQKDPRNCFIKDYIIASYQASVWSTGMSLMLSKFGTALPFFFKEKKYFIHLLKT